MELFIVGLVKNIPFMTNGDYCIKNPVSAVYNKNQEIIGVIGLDDLGENIFIPMHSISFIKFKGDFNCVSEEVKEVKEVKEIKVRKGKK